MTAHSKLAALPQAARLRQGLLLGTAVALLSGCSSIFKPEGPAQPQSVVGKLPEKWAGAASAEPMGEGWLEEFGDATLQAMVEEAWSNNATLLSAISRRDAAAAKAAVDKAGRLPRLDFQGGVGRQRQINDFLGNSTFVPDEAYISRIRFGLGLSWELDVWNRATDLANAALGDVASAMLDVEAAKFSLAGQAATLWFTFLAADQKVRLAQDIEANFVEAERIAGERQSGGLITTAELIKLRTDLAVSRGEIIARQLERDRAARALEVLIGRYPANALQASVELPRMPDPVVAGVPSSLLERRPDIQAASLRVLASDKRLLAAKKNLLPRFSITGSVATQAKYRDLLFDQDTFTWSLGGGILQPLFDGGQIRAGIRAQRALLTESVQKYREKAYGAFREVEDGLGAETALRAQLVYLQTALELSVDNEKLAQQSFANGTLDANARLATQRGTLQTRARLVDLQLALLTNRVALDLALGGSPLVREEPGEQDGAETANPSADSADTVSRIVDSMSNESAMDAASAPSPVAEPTAVSVSNTSSAVAALPSP